MNRDANILFLGDTHGQFGHILRAVHAYRPEALVFLGDIQAKRPLQAEIAEVLDLTEVWWIHGNHDTDSPEYHDNLFHSTLSNRNLHGRVTEVAGVRIAGLGGIFREKIWYPPMDIRYESAQDLQGRDREECEWRNGLPLRHRSSIFPEDYFSLIGQHADVLVTHEAPSCHPNGFDAIDELARSLGVEVSYHGHHHDRLDYSGGWTDLGFQAFGVGLRGITHHNGSVVLPGQEDENRMIRQNRVRCPNA